MSSSLLQGKRVPITQADAFMGPVLCEVFAEQGASVMAKTQSLIDAQDFVDNPTCFLGGALVGKTANPGGKREV